MAALCNCLCLFRKKRLFLFLFASGEKTRSAQHFMSKALQILLVEDSLSDRLLALDALSAVSTTNRVHVVTDGIEALEFLRHTGQYSQVPDADLILLDLNLPRKDGRKVLAELKVDPLLRKIPVVILASPGGASASGRAYPEHAQSFITKPIDIKQFNEVIRIFKDLWFPDLPERESPAELEFPEGKPHPRGELAASILVLPKEAEEVPLAALSSMLELEADEALVITDASGNILWVNTTFIGMCGYNLQELLDHKTLNFLQGPQTDQGAESRMKLAVAGGRSCTEEIANYHKDGHSYRVRLTINPLFGPDGIIHGFLAVERAGK